MNETKNKVENFIRRYVNIEKLGEDDDIFKSNIVNSLFVMQLVLFIEQEFDISVDNEVIATNDFNSITTISKYIAEKVDK